MLLKIIRADTTKVKAYTMGAIAEAIARAFDGACHIYSKLG